MAAHALTLNIGVLLAIATTGIALMLLLVSLLSYQRLRNMRLLLTSGAFLALAVKGALSAREGIVERDLDIVQVALDATILGFLYASVAKR